MTAQPTARWSGIARAEGNFIPFIDGDDLWTFNKLALQLDALQRHTEAGVVYSWIVFIDEDGNSCLRRSLFSTRVTFI